VGNVDFHRPVERNPLTIGDVVGAGGDGLVTIDFPNVGQKMVMLKYAPLEKV